MTILRAFVGRWNPFQRVASMSPPPHGGWRAASTSGEPHYVIFGHFVVNSRSMHSGSWPFRWDGHHITSWSSPSLVGMNWLVALVLGKDPVGGGWNDWILDRVNVSHLAIKAEVSSAAAECWWSLVFVCAASQSIIIQRTQSSESCEFSMTILSRYGCGRNACRCTHFM